MSISESEVSKDSIQPSSNKILSDTTSTTITGAMLSNVFEQLKEISKNALEYVLLYIVSIINDFISRFLELMVNKLASIIPNPKSIDESLSDNDKTLLILNKLLQDEDFKKLWSSFSNQIAQLLKTSFTQINDIVVNEGNEMSQSIQNLIGETLQGTLSSTLQGVLRGLVGVIPLADEILFVVPSAIGNMIPSIMKVFENLSSVLVNISTIMSEVTGTDAGIIKSVIDIVDKIEQIKSMFTDVLGNTNRMLEQQNKKLIGTFTTTSSDRDTETGSPSRTTLNTESMRGGKRRKTKRKTKKRNKKRSSHKFRKRSYRTTKKSNRSKVKPKK
jgi:hypothetical protein